MAVKIKQILEEIGSDTLLFGSWLTAKGVTGKEQWSYVQSGWMERVSHGVYKVAGANVSLWGAISAYNTQLGKRCIVGAETALELRGYTHYVPMGKPLAFIYTAPHHEMPSWFLEHEWDRTLRYQTSSLLGTEGLDDMDVEGHRLWVSCLERAILECLNRPNAMTSLLDTYYLMELLTTLRPEVMQHLLEVCSSVKAKRLFLYMAEKANHPWLKDIDKTKIGLGSGRRMIVPKGKYIREYNMTIPRDLAMYDSDDGCIF